MFIRTKLSNFEFTSPDDILESDDSENDNIENNE